MHTATTSPAHPVTRPGDGARSLWADNLKVVLVAGVVVAHTTMAWTHVGNWVFLEPLVRDPLLSVLALATATVGLFGMPLFFLVAGYFTPTSLSRKGLRHFVTDRAVRLLLPMLAFALLLSPPIEFVDPQNAGWTGGFRDFLPHVLWVPAPGPTWFLGVLFLFSVGYAVLRRVRPLRAFVTRAPTLRSLVVVALAVAVAGFPIMAVAPLGQEVWRLAIAQAPAWLTGFALGVVARERGWLPFDRELARRIRCTAWLALSGCVLVFVVASVTGTDLTLLLGGGSWQSAVVALVEGLLVVFASLWVVDLFERRFDAQGARGAVLGRAAYGAFLVHQGVLVALVLASHAAAWPPEVSYLAVTTAGVAGSFALGVLLAHVPGIRRVV
ncbi:acyltransferase [Intrasporangium sp. YIM S08009]|uniref:acyltransferase family protein n=1 Tax=Intrasporangium zincisolvens TaxID=3080018 RepID=UPI002B05F60F|nr:acyltransferase [Intrasporangium sp. YIM S08009]